VKKRRLFFFFSFERFAFHAGGRDFVYELEIVAVGGLGALQVATLSPRWSRV